MKEYCFKYIENLFPLGGMENLYKKTILLDKKLLTVEVMSEKSKKIVANSSDKSFSRPVFKKLLPVISLTVSASGKELSSKIDGFH